MVKLTARGKAPASGSGTQLTQRQTAAAEKKKLATEKRAGKSVAVPEIEESDSESADEPAPPKKAKTSKGKGAVVERDREKKPTVEQLYDVLKNEMTWMPTRFADVQLLRQLGLEADIEAMLVHLNMPKLHTMAYPLYKDVSCQFLSSLFVTVHKTKHARERWGKIAFTVHGRSYTMSFKEIERVMGFPDLQYSFPEKTDNLPQKLWKLISGNERSTGKDKNSHIRHPSVRYLHRLLVHIFYPRKEVGTITDEDMYLFFPAIKPYATHTQLPFSMELYSEVGWVRFFVGRLRYYRDWAWTTGDSSPKIWIGSLITPLLEFKGTSLGNDATAPIFLDAPYLRQATYFSGRYKGDYVYHYKIGGKKAEVVLPNRELTNLTGPCGVSFIIPTGAFLGEHGSLDPIGPCTESEENIGRAMPEADTVEDEDVEPVYGQRRYTFTPYSGTLPPGALHDAHDHISRLQRWNKAQDRTIEKLKKKCKEMSKTAKRKAKSTSKILRKIADVLTREGIAGCSRADFEFPDDPVPQPPPNPSALGFPLTERQQQRRWRNPPILPSSSGNKSPSLADSEEEIEIEEISSQPRFEEHSTMPGGYYTTFPPDTDEYEASASTRYP
ncbi:hypothetical protein Rs2_45054 [Raphanus sativus]|nr:hypothetical protein Rs2_45054 [Raphanus sativus]